MSPATTTSGSFAEFTPSAVEGPGTTTGLRTTGICHPERSEGSALALVVSDRPRIIEILEATKSFRAEEIAVALELFDESLENQGRDYEFIGVFSPEGELTGYACYGATPGTEGTYDLYWIAVHPEHQGEGGGSRLLDEVERRLNEREARLLVVETSARSDYESTRRFYERRGYGEHARIGDFYAVGDDRVIYAKRL
jgi:ribosomal protein S18 acetylase RimI-like enzyme